MGPGELGVDHREEEEEAGREGGRDPASLRTSPPSHTHSGAGGAGLTERSREGGSRGRG